MAKLPQHIVDDQIEKFAQSYAIEGKYVTAYRCSHPTSINSRKVVASRNGKAFYLKHQQKIDARISVVRGEFKAAAAADNTEIHKSQIVAVLQSMLKGGMGAKPADILKACELAARIGGYFAPEKIEQNTEISVSNFLSDLEKFQASRPLPSPAVPPALPPPEQSKHAEVIDIQVVKGDSPVRNQGDKLSYDTEPHSEPKDNVVDSQ